MSDQQTSELIICFLLIHGRTWALLSVTIFHFLNGSCAWLTIIQGERIAARTSTFLSPSSAGFRATRPRRPPRPTTINYNRRTIDDFKKELRADVCKYQPEVCNSEKFKILKKIHNIAHGKLSQEIHVLLRSDNYF